MYTLNGAKRVWHSLWFSALLMCSLSVLMVLCGLYPLDAQAVLTYQEQPSGFRAAQMIIAAAKTFICTSSCSLTKGAVSFCRECHFIGSSNGVNSDGNVPPSPP